MTAASAVAGQGLNRALPLEHIAQILAALDKNVRRSRSLRHLPGRAGERGI